MYNLGQKSCTMNNGDKDYIIWSFEKDFETRFTSFVYDCILSCYVWSCGRSGVLYFRAVLSALNISRGTGQHVVNLFSVTVFIWYSSMNCYNPCTLLVFSR